MAGARIAPLDGLRGIAIVCVFLHHLLLLPLLWGGVDLFFVLSGFLITSLLIEQARLPPGSYFGRFYARRARRLLPAYVAALALTVALFGAAWLHWWPFYLGAMNFTRPLGVPTPNTLPLWSLALEEQFYLLWPFACFFLSRRALLRLALGLVVLAPILRILGTPLFHTHWAIYMLLPFRMDTLAAGAAIALLWPAIETRQRTGGRTRLLAGAIVVAAGALIVLAWLGHAGYTTLSNTKLTNFALYECILLLAVSALLLTLAGFCHRLLASWPLVWLGRLSYSIYLCHLDFIRLSGWGRRWLLAIALTLAYSAAMWFLVEAPILRRGRRRIPPDPSPAGNRTRLSFGETCPQTQEGTSRQV